MIDHLEVGGAQRHTVLLASWLARAGHEVVLAFAGPARIPVDPAVMLLPLSLESVSRRRDAVFEEAALALARRFQPTVVHAHLYASALAAAGVAERHDYRWSSPTTATAPGRPRAIGGCWRGPCGARAISSPPRRRFARP
jgi:hypothetical protein